MKAKSSLDSSACAVPLLVFALGLNRGARGFTQRSSLNLSVRVSPDDASYQAIRQRPVMVVGDKRRRSHQADGGQSDSSARFSLPPGIRRKA